MEYFFTLTYALGPDDADLDQLVERLGEEGCTDSLVGLGAPGRIALEFSREASSPAEAMTSAMADVARAIPTAELIEATPDYLTPSAASR